MSKDNIKGFRITFPQPDNTLTEPLVEVLAKDGTTVDQAVIDYCKQWGVTDKNEIDRAERWNQAVNDKAAGNITQEDFDRGQNPYRSTTFEHPGKGGL